MKRRVYVFMFIFVFFFILLIPDFPMIPEQTIETACAERVDTLKVEETIPGVFVERDYDLFNYYHWWPSPTKEAWSNFETDVTEINWPAATYSSDELYSEIQQDCNEPLDSVSDLYRFEFFLYFPAKFTGNLTIEGQVYYNIEYDTDYTSGWITYTVSDTASSTNFDTTGRLTVVIRVEIEYLSSTSSEIRIYKYYFVNGEYRSETLLNSRTLTTGSTNTITRIIHYIDYALFIPDTITLYVTADHTIREDNILHHIMVPSYAYGANITVYKPQSWGLYNITPTATVTEYSDRIEITNTIEGDYDIYFTSTDFWNYPRRYDTRISYFDQKGDYIPFESVFTYYNLSWSTVTSPTYQPLYSDTFTMDPAQYLSILVKDRWGNVLLEKKNLEYQEFYNFTITLYSFQVYNWQEDFIYVKIRKTGTADWYGQYVGPWESMLLRLYPTDYDLEITFPNGTIYSTSFTLSDDTTYLVSGTGPSQISGLTVSQIVGYVSRSAARFFDQRGTYIPFQAVFTYYNISDTTVTTPTYRPLYVDTFLMKPEQYLSILVKDRWGTVLLEKKNLEYQEFYNFTLTLYTFKLVSFQDDFIYMMLKPVGAVNWYTEWVAPNEIEEEHLYPGTYNLTIQFKNGTEIHETVDLTTDVTYIVSGWTLSKLAGRVDINFAHFIGVSLKNNYTGLPLPISDFTFMVNDTVRSISTSELFYIEGDFADVKVYDVFNHLLYHKAVNVTETGWLNIGLNVTHLVLRNPYEIYAVNMTLTASSTGVSKTFIVPPLESKSIFIGNDTYSYTVKLLDPELTSVLKEVSDSLTIPAGKEEYVVLFGWNIFPDAYMQVNFLGETGTINLICEIMIYMNYSKLPIPSVYLEAYINDILAGTGWTDSQGRAAIILEKPLNGSGTLSIKATKLGVTRWYNTTYSIWGWMTVEEPPMIVQGEVGSYNLIFSNPSRVGETPIKIENATVIFKIYDENATIPTVTLNKTTIDIPPGSSQFTFTLNTTDLPTGNYILEIEVIYANSTFAKKQIPFTVTPKPEYRIVVPWWLILTIVFIALAASIIAWLVIRYMGEITRKTPQGKIKFKPRVLRNLD